LTNTFLRANLFAVRVKAIVIVENNPSGTLATIIPMPKTRFVMKLYPRRKPRPKNRTPRTIAIVLIITIKRSSSSFNGESPVLAVEAKLAIYPITVFSPVLMTIPLPVPSLQSVPKKQRFFVSRGFS
jgi:hypothetical protein